MTRSIRRGCSAALSMIAAAALCSTHVLAAPENSACAKPETELQARFLASANINKAETGSSQFIRWNERKLRIQLFVERNAHALVPPPDRNLAILNGVGLLAWPPLQFGVAIGGPKPGQRVFPDNPSDDIKLIFVDQPTKQRVFENLPRAVITSSEGERCRVYLDLASPTAAFTPIYRAHLLVDDDTQLADLPSCVADALVR